MASAYIGFPHSTDTDKNAADKLHRAVSEMRSATDRIAGLLAVTGLADKVAQRSSTTKADSLDNIRDIRDARNKMFGEDIFFDPAWNILLYLYRNELDGRKVIVSDTYSASGVPQTTGLRWLGILEKRGHVVRSADPIDGRRVFVKLTPAASERMEQLTDLMLNKFYGGE